MPTNGNRLAGKTALVTAAAQGIGHAIAQALVREGATVLATDVQLEKLQQGFAGSGAEVQRLDATDDAAVSALSAARRDVDVLVNCVGWVAEGSILDSGLDVLDRSFEINVKAMARMIRAFLPAMRARRAGSIINIASVVSSVAAAPNRFAYAASKAAVIGLTMSVARDFITEGIRCNAISPGTIDTPSLEDRLRKRDDIVKARAEYTARQPMGRLGNPAEIAEIAVLLASDEARFMTGANLIIDGGMSL